MLSSVNIVIFFSFLCFVFVRIRSYYVVQASLVPLLHLQSSGIASVYTLPSSDRNFFPERFIFIFNYMYMCLEYIC